MGKPKLTKTRDQHIYSYQDSKGTKKFAYRYRYTRSDGKKADAYKQGFSTSKDAVLALTSIQAELLSGNYIKFDNADITIKEICDIYVQYKKKQWRKSTLVTNQHSINAICKKIGHIKLNKLNKVNYQLQFIEPQLESVAASTVKAQHTTLNSIINFAVEEEYLNKNRIRGLSIDYEMNHYAISKADLERVLEFTKKKRPVIYPAIATLGYTGMRCGEVCGLKWKDVDFTKGIISVNRTLDRHGERPPKTKNSIRKLPLPHTLEEILKKTKKERQQKLFKDAAMINANLLDEEYVFLNQRGNSYRHENFQSFFKFLYKHEKILCRAHVLRHTYATILIGEGFDIATVASLLGDTIATVQKVYVHAIDDHREKAAKHFNEILSKII